MITVLARTSSSESNGTTATTGPIKWKKRVSDQEFISPYKLTYVTKKLFG